MKPNIYAGILNTERIAAYQKLAENYNLEEGTVGHIFCEGANWGIGVTERIPEGEKSECFPNECDHPRNRRTYYDGGSSWCTKCWSYVDVPRSRADCKYFDEAQGRHRCIHPKIGHRFFMPKKCIEICNYFKEK
jgi:hypothetical protein